MVLPVGLAAFSVGWLSGYDSVFRRESHISYVRAVFSYVDLFFSYVKSQNYNVMAYISYVTCDFS
jgi:hypothetical protein